MEKGQNDSNYVATGITGLDEILEGGLRRGSTTLVEGNSGAGKTTLALRFSVEGLRSGESVLYMAFAETRQDLERVARVHGWDIAELHIEEAANIQERPSSIFHPAEVELEQAVLQVKAAVERVNPKRLVLDSLSEFRIMGQNTLRHRREILALQRFLITHDCTVIFIKNTETDAEDHQRSLIDGVIRLEFWTPDYGTDRRRLRVAKLRGRSYSGGYHDYIIRTGGLEVFPRLLAAEHRHKHRAQLLSSGLPSLDQLLGKGIMAGSSSLLIGPAGSGKSTIAALFVASAAQRGEMALYFTFDELPEQIFTRTKGLGLDLKTFIDKGLVDLQQVDPAEMPPGEFAHRIKENVEGKEDVSVVVIDSLNGYLHAMPNERLLVQQLHELLSYLGQNGVSSFLTLVQKGVGGGWDTPVDASYLADNLILLRFFEAQGAIHRAISVVKMRSGQHEGTIRELNFEPGRIDVGAPLEQFQGVLTGTPHFLGQSEQLMKD